MPDNTESGDGAVCAISEKRRVAGWRELVPMITNSPLKPHGHSGCVPTAVVATVSPLHESVRARHASTLMAGSGLPGSPSGAPMTSVPVRRLTERAYAGTQPTPRGTTP